MNFFTFEINVFWCGPSKWSVESGSIVFEVSWFDHLKFEGRSFLCGSLSRPGRAGHIKKRCLPSLLFTLKKVKSHFETLESYFCNNSETQLWIILIWKRDLLQIWQMWEWCRLQNRSRKVFSTTHVKFDRLWNRMWTVDWQAEARTEQWEQRLFHWNMAARILSISKEKFLHASGINSPLKQFVGTKLRRLILLRICFLLFRLRWFWILACV